MHPFIRSFIHSFIQKAYVRHAQHEARHATVPTQVCVAAVSQTLRVLLPLIPRRATVYALLRYDDGYPTGCLFSSRVVGFWVRDDLDEPALLEVYTRSSLGLLGLRQALAEMKLHGAVTVMLPEVLGAHEVRTGDLTLDSGLLLSCSFPFLSLPLVSVSRCWCHASQCLGEDPARIVKCSSSRRIEPFIAT